MQHLRSKFNNFSYLAIEQITRLGVGLVVMTLIARQLGPDNLAAFAYVFSIAAILVPIGRFGLDAIILRQVAAEPGNSAALLTHAAILSVTMSIVAALISVALVVVTGGPKGVTVTLMMFAACTIIAVPAEIPVLYLKAIERIGLVTVFRTGTAVIFGIVVSVAALSGAGLSELTLLRGIEALAIGAASSLVVLLLIPYRRNVKVSANSIIRIGKSALPLMIAGLATLAYMRIDQIMLGQMAPPDQLGKYSVAARIAEVANILPAVLQSTLYAAIVRNFNRDRAGFDTYMQRIFDLFAIIAWPVMAGIAFLAYFLIVPLFGEEYSGAIPMVLLLLLGTPLFFLYYAWGTMLTVREWMWLAPAVAGLGAAVNIGLNLALIPDFGGEGAAIATVISYGIASIGGSLVIGKLRPSAIAMIRALDPLNSSRRLIAIYGPPWKLLNNKGQPDRMGPGE